MRRSQPAPFLAIFLTVALWVLSCGVSWWFYTSVHGLVFAQDWMVYDTASTAALRGDYALLADGVRFTGVLAMRFEDMMRWSMNLHPWVYPPPFLLLILPLGLVGPMWAYVLFVSVGFVGLLIAITLWPAPRWQRVVLMVSAAACPGTLFTILVGQNAFLSAALLLTGAALLDRRPLVAGALLGLMVFKPQLAVLIPVALLAGRYWRALVAAGCSAALFCGASLATFGARVWVDWGRMLFVTSTEFSNWQHAGRRSGVSVYACAYAVSHSEPIAGFAQDAAIVLAGLAVAHVYASQTNQALRISALLLAVGIAAPHIAGYDMVICALGTTIFWLHGATNGFRPGELLLSLVCWMSPLVFTACFTRLVVIIPLSLLALLLCVAARSRPVGELGGRRTVCGDAGLVPP